MNNLLFTFLCIFVTIQLRAQTGLQISSSCLDTSFCLAENECFAADQFFSITATTDCSSSQIDYNFFIDFFDNGMIDSSGSANIFTGDFPIGIHRITFTAFDLCGGTETCEMVTEVKDCFAPTIICGVETDTLMMSPYGSIEFFAKDLVSPNSFDNCTDFEELKFSFSADSADTSMSAQCVDVLCEASIPLELWVTDASGNQSSCLDTIVIIDMHLSCALPSQTIMPIANDWQGNSMENVDFLIEGLIYEFDMNPTLCMNFNPVLTDFIGDQLSAESNDSVLNGVSTYDIVLISKHIIGIEEFTDPHQLIAADVNFSNTVTTLDIVKIRSVILQIEAEFIHGKSWVFTPSSHLINGGMTHYFFTGIKLGDVNGSADPNGLTGQTTTTRTEDGTLRLFTKDIILKKGKTYTVPTFAQQYENIMGGQFTLQFDVDALDFQDLAGNTAMNLGKENFGLSQIEEGLILASWNHATQQNLAKPTELYNITFTAKQDGELSDFLSITSRGMEAEAYVEKNGETEFWNIELNFENEITNQGISVFPNPFSEKTELNFSLENNEQVQLRVYDVTGRLVFSQEKNMEKGAHQFEMKKKDLGASGIYFFQLLIGEELTAGKIMVE